MHHPLVSAETQSRITSTFTRPPISFQFPTFPILSVSFYPLHFPCTTVTIKPFYAEFGTRSTYPCLFLIPRTPHPELYTPAF